MVIPPQVYQPPVPDDEIYIPPEPSFSTTPSIESRGSPSLAPVIVPGPQIAPQQPAPPIFIHPPSQAPPSQPGITESPRSRSPTSPRIPGQPTIIVPPQSGAVPPGGPWGPPSTQHVYDERPDQPVLFPHPGAQPPFQVVASPGPGRSGPSEFDGREGPQQPGQGQPIIIHPPTQTHITPSPYGPPGPGIIVPPHRGSRSTTPTTESPRSIIGAPYPPTVFPGGPFPGAQFPGAPLPGVPLPGPMPGPGFPPTALPITVVGPSRASPEPEYRSPRESPRPYPESARSRPYPESSRPYPESPRPYPESRAPSRYAEGPYQPIPPPMPIPTAIHIEPEPYQYRRGARYPESRTQSSRSPSIERDDREPRGDRGPSYRSPSPEYPVPLGVGPQYDRGTGPTVIQPPPVTHVHQYPSTYPAGSRTPSPPPTEREGEPLPHPFGQPAQFPPTEQAPMPIGRPSTRSRAPTIVEVTGPEPIQVYPPPDHRRPWTESDRKRCV